MSDRWKERMRKRLDRIEKQLDAIEAHNELLRQRTLMAVLGEKLYYRLYLPKFFAEDARRSWGHKAYCAHDYPDYFDDDRTTRAIEENR